MQAVLDFNHFVIDGSHEAQSCFGSNYFVSLEHYHEFNPHLKDIAKTK